MSCLITPVRLGATLCMRQEVDAGQASMLCSYHASEGGHNCMQSMCRKVTILRFR